MISILKRTKCITTLGPSSTTLASIQALVENGATCVRLNFSHGNHAEHQARIEAVRAVSQKLKLPIAIMLDTKGPEIRTHTFKNGYAEIKKDTTITIIDDEEIIGTSEKFSVNYHNLAKDIKINDFLLVDDGKLTLKVLDIKINQITCQAINTHTIKDRRAINIPNVKLSLPFISQQDKADLIFGCQQQVDYVAASFVTAAQELKDMRKLLDENNGHHIQIIAKIESQLAVKNFDEILQAADAIMIARGDLGVEIPFEKVPFHQFEWIKKCRAVNKPVIVATQMLDSMITNPHPTRAEVTDVYVSVVQGATSTMLSGESANGNYPILAIATMAKIIQEAESHQLDNTIANELVLAKDQLVSQAIKIILTQKPQYLITNGSTAFVNTIANAHLPVIIIPIVVSVVDYHKFAINYGIYAFLAAKDVTINLNNHLALQNCIKNSYQIPRQAKVLIIDDQNSTKPLTTFIAK